MGTLDNRSLVKDNRILDDNAARINLTAPADVRSTVKINQVVDYVFWILVTVVLLRFAFKLIGANHQNIFVILINRITEPIVGIFRGVAQGIVVGSMVFESASVISLVMLWLAYRAVLKLIAITRRA